MTESVANVQVAAGAFAGFAPAGTAKPTLPATGPIVADPDRSPGKTSATSRRTE